MGVIQKIKLCLLAVTISFMPLSADATGCTNSVFSFEVIATNLIADTFQVVLSVCTLSDRTYGIEYHDGPPGAPVTNWIIATCFPGTGDAVQFIDTNRLPLVGRTYRAVLPRDACEPHPLNIPSMNEEFIAYPFMNDPQVRVTVSSPNDQVHQIMYGEGLYSNAVTHTINQNSSMGFYRMFSPDNDPSNAVIQVQESLMGNSWTNIPND